MKALILLTLCMMSSTAFAFDIANTNNTNNTNMLGQFQVQESSNKSNANVTSHNRTDNSSYSGGNDVKNKTSTVVQIEGDEGDKIPASSAIAGIATECVSVMAAQAQKGGVSLGGASAECQSAIAAKLYFDLAVTFKDADPERAKRYLDLGHTYAEKAAPGTIQVMIKDTSETAIDLSIIIGLVTLLL